MPECKSVASDISVNDTRMKIKDLCRFVNSYPANEIIASEDFWELLEKICKKIFLYVSQSKSYTHKMIIAKWIRLLKLLNSKDKSVQSKLFDSTIKKMFFEFLNIYTKHPHWFIKICFNSLLEDMNFGEQILPYLFNMVWGAINYSTQETYIHVIISNFENNCVYNYIREKITNKEQQHLFDSILGDDNNTNRSIREFLNKFNLDQVPVNIFSFMSSEIKVNGLLLVKNTWVDFNMLSNTITFSCKLIDLSHEDIVPNSLEDVYELDTVWLKISHIGQLRFKRGINDSEDQLTLELIKPLTADSESSNKFLEPFQILLISVAENKERFLKFILNHFAKIAEHSIDILDQNNFEFDLSHSSDESQDSNSELYTDTAHSDETRDEVINNQNIDDSELDEPDVVEASVSDHEQYNSTIFRTPQHSNDPNISVEETIAPSDDEYSDASSERPDFKSTIFSTPLPRSSNISVAASYDSPCIPTTQEDSGIDKEPSQNSYKSVGRVGLSQLPTSVPETPGINIKMPEFYNGIPVEVIDLTSPEIITVAQLKAQIERRENFENIVEHLEIKSEASDGTVLSDLRKERVSDVDGDANKTLDSNIKKEPSAGPSNLNVTDDHQPLVSSVVMKSSQDAQKDQQDSQKDFYTVEDDQSFGGTQLSVISKVSSSSSRGRKRKMKNKKSTVDNDLAEYDETSFFSDKETKANEFTYTKTRVIKKYRPFQYSADIDANKRKSTPRKKKTKSPVEDTEITPTVKRIKTILPKRIINNDSHIPSEENDARKRTERKKIISNINYVDHLQEQSEGQVFRMFVPSDQTILSQSQNVTENRQEFKQEVEIPISRDQNINETLRKIYSNMDRFDKIKYNIPATQCSQKNINFFSSSSCASQASQEEPQHQQVTTDEETSHNVNEIIDLVSQVISDGKRIINAEGAATEVVPDVRNTNVYNSSVEQNSLNIMKNRTRNEDFIKEIQNNSGDKEKLRKIVEKFAEEERLSIIEAFRVLMPSIELCIKQLCNICFVFVPLDIKTEFRNKMKKYFTDEGTE